MSDYENEDACWSALEGFRVKLTSTIDPSRITPYLRQCKVLNPDDEEQVLSDPSLVTRKRKVGVLLDLLQRTGHKGYVAFLESLELYYPQLYKRVTGKEPARVFSMIIDASGESGLTQLLMAEVTKLQKKVQDLTALLSSKDDFIKELRVKDSLLRKHQERVQRLREDCEAGARELRRCKDENYNLALRLARQSEEKGAVLMRNRDLQLEVDQLKHSLMKAEDDCKVERKHTLKLRHAMEQRPSQELLWELQQEKALLQARVQELEASAQKWDRGSPYIQVLEEDWRQALREHQEQASTIFSLRKDLRQAEALRTRCVEEKEVMELQCSALRKDSRMYKDRIEAILQQMEEVATERDQAMAVQEQLHAQHARSLQEKDGLRKRVRELAEKADELQLLLFQREGQLLAAEARLKRQQVDALVLSSDLEDSSPRSSQELSLPQGLEEDTQLPDKGSFPGGPAEGECPERPFPALQKERFSLNPTVRLPRMAGGGPKVCALRFWVGRLEREGVPSRDSSPWLPRALLPSGGGAALAQTAARSAPGLKAGGTRWASCEPSRGVGLLALQPQVCDAGRVPRGRGAVPPRGGPHPPRLQRWSGRAKSPGPGTGDREDAGCGRGRPPSLAG
ncbi:caspase recruitment domain-containing protein 9 [Tupaia chinensis]|uniref:caspase recruitment domain-containing protein 9 n=1 Tax=Tupaia chinensis TaxID=246437 RepID=UPI000FFB2F0E|nr:caspase recruitment domain-containing protein 9 [Tupaia chinensis]